MNKNATIDKQAQVFSNFLIKFLKKQTRLQQITTLRGSSNFTTCQICKAKDHQLMIFPKYANSKCGGLHKIENYGFKCNFYGEMVHAEKKCWKNNLKNEIVATYFMEVLVEDKEATLGQLNEICGLNYEVFYHVKVPKKRIAMNVLVGTTPSVEREATSARGDGGDI